MSKEVGQTKNRFSDTGGLPLLGVNFDE